MNTWDEIDRLGLRADRVRVSVLMYWAWLRSAAVISAPVVEVGADTEAALCGGAICEGRYGARYVPPHVSVGDRRRFRLVGLELFR